jgi:D-alanyl-D-alanine carboxypeptidase/D-alanyl-D-alanine-endopeptidase (penicillin-binding protein 4)
VNRVKVVCVTVIVMLWLSALLSTATSCSPQAGPTAKKPVSRRRESAPPREKPLTANAQRFAERAAQLLDSGTAGQGEWGALVIDAQTGETLYQRNAEKFFVPASNMKLLTTAFALATLGRDYRFRTTAETRGVIAADGTLSGDVALVGRGDPNLSNRRFPFTDKEEFDGVPERALSEIADAIVARGVKAISGDIVGDDSYFPAAGYPSGWEIDDMVWEYGAAISAIVVNDNTVKLTLTPGSNAGDPVSADVAPATPDFLVENHVVTSIAEAKADLRLSRDPGSRVVVVTGTLPARHAPRSLTLAVEDPARHAAAVLKLLLERRGVAVGGVARAVHDSVNLPDAPRILAEHTSVPIGESVKLVNKISQNLHTEMYLRAAARQTCAWKTPEELVNVPRNFYAQAGIVEGDVVQADGSGLSRHDLVTPRALAAVLQYAQTEPWFDAYYASLPIAGVDGTLEDRMKNTAAVGRIHAKSGSLEHVRTRSGYAETASGQRLIFSFMGNNQAGKNHEASDILDGLCIALVEEWGARPSRASSPKRPAHKH